jgi:hypothetical protein
MYANSLTCVETESSYKNGCRVYGVSGRLELLWVKQAPRDDDRGKSAPQRLHRPVLQ